MESPKRASPYAILYRVCPTYRVSHVATASGFVEIPEEVVSRIEGDAEKETIPLEAEVEQPEQTRSPFAEAPAVEKDRPNTRAIVRRVRLREGNVCANPHCGSRDGLHVHHVKARSQGGRTELWNELLLCARCHALSHMGLLEIRGTPGGDLEWIPRAEKLELDLANEGAELSEIPTVVAQPLAGTAGRTGAKAEIATGAVPRAPAAGATPLSTTAGSGLPGQRRFSTAVESGPQVADFSTMVENRGRDFPEEFRHARRGLETLGYHKKEARSRITRACEEFLAEGKELEEEAIFNRAIRVKV